MDYKKEIIELLETIDKDDWWTLDQIIKFIKNIAKTDNN